MLNDFSFSFGKGTIRCCVRSDGFGKRWHYQMNASPEQPGPMWSPTDTTSSVSFAVRKLYSSVRGAGVPVAGRALYALARDLVNIESHPSQYGWLQPGRCFEGHPDETTRAGDGVDILLYNPADPEQLPARVASHNVRRVEPEDCGES